MIGGLFTELGHEAWARVPGRSVKYQYDENNNVIVSTFKNGDDILFVQRMTYDEKNNVLSIVCSNN